MTLRSNTRIQASELPLQDKPWTQRVESQERLLILPFHFKHAWESQNHSMEMGTQSVPIWCLHPSEFPLSSSYFSFSFSFFWMYTHVSSFFIFLFYSSFEGMPWCATEDVSPCTTPNPTIQTLTVLVTDRWVALPYQMSLVLEPRARSPSVEKKSSISFSRSRLRFSASSRARSEFRSLISSMRCFFLSCSISCSKRSICAHKAALDSSSLGGGSTDRKQRSLTFTFHLWIHYEMVLGQNLKLH